MKTIVCFHAGCPDGFAAAWAAWMALGDKAEYIPCDYHSTQIPDVTDAHVFILDYAFKPEVTLQLAEKARIVTLLDHHKTAAKLHEGVEHERLAMVFDMNKSGATLAWTYFHGDKPCWLVDYAEDRDLWRHAKWRSKEINAFLMAMPRTFGAYSEALKMGPEKCAELGVGCLTWVRYYVDHVKADAQRVRFLGHDNVALVNAPTPACSEVVGELSEQDGVPFAVGWRVCSDGGVAYSLRSRGEFDVAALAQRMGGGGHMRAAGFSWRGLPDELEEALVLRANPDPEIEACNKAHDAERERRREELLALGDVRGLIEHGHSKRNVEEAVILLRELTAKLEKELSRDVE